MNGITSHLSRFPQSLVVTAWLIVLDILLLRGQYVAFLRPGFAWILVLAVAILLGFLWVNGDKTRIHRFNLAEALRLVILLLPLLYLANVQGQSLDSYAFANRSLGLPSLAVTNAPPNLVQRNDPDDTTLYEITLANLYRDPQQFTGRRIRLTGRYHPGGESTQNLGPHVCMVFRFAVNCCAADATPLAVLANLRPGDVNVEENDWVDIEGVFRIRNQDGRSIPMLDHATLCKAPEPQRPYLF